jgi:hypothetical protein
VGNRAVVSRLSRRRRACVRDGRSRSASVYYLCAIPWAMARVRRRLLLAHRQELSQASQFFSALIANKKEETISRALETPNLLLSSFVTFAASRCLTKRKGDEKHLLNCIKRVRPRHRVPMALSIAAQAPLTARTTPRTLSVSRRRCCSDGRTSSGNTWGGTAVFAASGGQGSAEAWVPAPS